MHKVLLEHPSFMNSLWLLLGHGTQNCDHDALRWNIPTIWLALAEVCQVIPCQEKHQKTVSLHC